MRDLVKQLAVFVGAFLFGHWAVTKAAPAIQARYESMDLDSVWELWDGEEWM